MGSARKPRGRLPQRVYWVRRSIVLVVALLLVFGVGKLIGGLGQDDPGTATPSSNNAPPQQVPSGSVTLGPVAPSATGRAKVKQPLPEPDGECVDEDVRVQPSVPQASVGTPVVIQLQLQGTQLACTFDVSPETMVVKIESGKDRIWSSQDCPKAIPTTQVVVRSSQATSVPVSWSGRRSDDNCTNTPDWVLPGFYHVYAAALGLHADRRPVPGHPRRPQDRDPDPPPAQARQHVRLGSAEGQDLQQVHAHRQAQREAHWKVQPDGQGQAVEVRRRQRCRQLLT